MINSKGGARERSIPDRLFFRIGDVAEIAGVKPYVLRYWESEFPLIQPEKSSSGQRVYKRSDVEVILMIRHLLYEERYSIEGARKMIKELRRDGELKAFQQEIQNSAPSNAVPAAELEAHSEAAEPTKPGLTVDRERLAALSRELDLLVKKPLSALFRF